MRKAVTLFLCGDVMTGRGVDQIFAQSTAPDLREPFIRDARDYVEFAEETNGAIPRPIDPAYIWGDALGELDLVAPEARIVNLETTITTSDDYWPRKSIHYRMHPANIGCLTAARINVCTLANNHVLDFGYPRLIDTLDALRAAGIRTAGAGCDLADAERPAIIDLPYERRVIVFSLGSPSSGIPPVWSATAERSGVDLLPDLSAATADRVLERVNRVTRPGDLVVVSIHWGSNWGYEVPSSHIRFAHTLLDGNIAVVHGHSSHHPRPLEIYNQKLVLYGCGDFLTDYEGISGYEEYRGDLALMYFPTLDADTGELLSLRMTPMRIRRMQATRTSRADAAWLCETLVRASESFGGEQRIAAWLRERTLELLERAKHRTEKQWA